MSRACRWSRLVGTPVVAAGFGLLTALPGSATPFTWWIPAGLFVGAGMLVAMVAVVDVRSAAELWEVAA